MRHFPQGRAAACLRGLRAAQHIKPLSAHHGQANHGGGENQQYRPTRPYRAAYFNEQENLDEWHAYQNKQQ